MRLDSRTILRLISGVTCCLPLRSGGIKFATTFGIAAFIFSMRSICAGMAMWVPPPGSCSLSGLFNHQRRNIFRTEDRNFLQRYLRILDPFGWQGNFIRRPVPDGFIHAKVSGRHAERRHCRSRAESLIGVPQRLSPIGSRNLQWYGYYRSALFSSR